MVCLYGGESKRQHRPSLPWQQPCRPFTIHTVTSAALSKFKKTEWVAVTTAFATAVTSWVEFNGYISKLDSYTSTIRALESHLSWWHSLSDSEKAGTSANDKLVESGEQFILATRYSRSLTLQDRKKVADAGAEGAATGKAATEGATSGKTTTEIESQASQLKQLRQQLATTQRRLDNTGQKQGGQATTSSHQ